jgi:hypothetical protein
MPVYLGPTPSTLPYVPPTLSDALTRLRQDIFDQAGASPRWADSDLSRAIDRALDQYSFVVPWIQAALIPAVANSRLYTLPPAIVAPPQPAWWVEDVEYPEGFYPRRLVPFRERLQPPLGTPAAPVATVLTPAGVLNGNYQYVVTFTGVGGETAASAVSNTVAAALKQVSITLPLGPGPYTSARNIYRTAAGGTTFLFLAQIADNTTTTYTDNTADGGLGVAVAPSSDSTGSVPLVELSLTNAQLPAAGTTDLIGITYASKHVINASGTTVPEQHHDVVLLGAAAYACLSFQVPTNDLFEYQDGQLRDRVDETKAPEHWLATGKTLLNLFTQRLEDVKRQRDAGGGGGEPVG